MQDNRHENTQWQYQPEATPVTQLNGVIARLRRILGMSAVAPASEEEKCSDLSICEARALYQQRLWLEGYTHIGW